MTWRKVTLGDCVTLQSGGTPSKANASYWSGPVPWVSAKDMTTLRLRDTEDHVSLEAVGNGTRLVPKGTLLAVVRGMSLAKEFRIVELQRPMTFNQDVKAISPRDGVDSRFILYSLLAQQEYVLGIADEAAHGTKRLQTDRFLAVPISLPSLIAQRRIASILSAYDDLIENNTRRIAILEEMARRIYEEWFVHFRFPGHEQVKMVESELGLIPEGWQVESLGNVCSRLQSGGTPSRSNDGYWQDGTVDWYKTKELWDGFLFNSEEKITELAVSEKKTRVFEAGVILMAIYGSPTVGRFGITTRRCACNQAALGIEPDTERITKWFLVHTLYSLRQEFNNKAQGAAQQNISKEKVAETKFVLPSMTTLSGFESLVAPMWEMLLNLQKKNLNLRATRDLLLPKLISGELDVSTLPEPEEAIAA